MCPWAIIKLIQEAHTMGWGLFLAFYTFSKSILGQCYLHLNLLSEKWIPRREVPREELPPVFVWVYSIYSSYRYSPINQEPQPVNKMKVYKRGKYNMCITMWAGRHCQVLLDTALIKSYEHDMNPPTELQDNFLITYPWPGSYSPQHINYQINTVLLMLIQNF